MLKQNAGMDEPALMTFSKIKKFLKNYWLICLNNFYVLINISKYTTDLYPQDFRIYFLLCH